MSRITAEVKFYRIDKGFGFFANPDPAGRDIFVHVEEVHAAGLASLAPRQILEFEVEDTAKGPKAVRLTGGDCPHCHGTGKGERDVKAA